MQMRRTRQYPPYYYVVLVTVSHPELLKAVQVTEKLPRIYERIARSKQWC